MHADLLVKRSSEVVREDLGPDTMLFHPGRDAIHVLNHTSAFLWDCLERPRSVAELERALRLAFDVPAEADVGADVSRIVAEFREAGLLEEP